MVEETKEQLKNRIDTLTVMNANQDTRIEKLTKENEAFKESEKRLLDYFTARTKELQSISRIVNGAANFESKVLVIRDLLNSVPQVQ